MQTNIILLLGLVVIIVIIITTCKSRSPFTFNNSQYQYSNPNLKRENDYYKCISGECKGNTHDYRCLERCHLKAYRKGMGAPDIKDMICRQYSKNDDQ